METLGGNRSWSDRFLGNHVALLYYWLLVLAYLFSPSVAYQFMELLEAHAVDTYSAFIAENRSLLIQLLAPEVAKSYCTSGDLYLCTFFFLITKLAVVTVLKFHTPFSFYCLA
jgi:ubiquinol oxidase